MAGQRQRSYRGDAVLSHARAIGLRLGGVAGAAAAWRTRHSAHAEDLTVRRAVVLIYATAVAYFLRALELRVAGRATLEAATALTVAGAPPKEELARDPNYGLQSSPPHAFGRVH